MNDCRVMMPRRVIRWKSFWLGVLVLDFAGWLWWDSTRADSVVSLAVSPVVVKVRNAEDGTYLHGGMWSPLLAPPDGLSFERRPRVQGGDGFEMVDELIERQLLASRVVFITHEGAVAGVLACWLGWIAWRSLRMKRLARTMPMR